MILLIILLSLRKENGLNCNLPLWLLQGNTLHEGFIQFYFFGADPIILWAMKNLFISNTTHRASL